MTESGADPSTRAFSLLLGLARRVRGAASADEVGFVMVNEILMLAPYRQALLYRDGAGIVAASGVAVIDRNAPFIQWASKVASSLASGLNGPARPTAVDLPESLARDWREWLPGHLLAIPLMAPGAKRLGVLFFVRDGEWSEAETVFLAEAAETCALAWAFHLRPGPGARMLATWRRLPLRLWGLAAGLTCAAFFPVHLSVLAPADVVARDAVVVRAPMEGIVEHVAVEPNQPVSVGQPLFQIDATMIRGRLDVARKSLETAKAEYEQAAQQALYDAKAQAQLGLVSGRIQERQAEVDTLSEQLARCGVVASRAGVAVIDDPSEWNGRPVALGEKVLALADEKDTEIEAWLAPGDVIDFPPRAPVLLFLNVDPTHPVHAHLRYVGYESLSRPDGTIAHRVRADIETGEDRPRLGLKGTARLEGGRVSLAFWLLRRPWTTVRQILGL